MNGIEQAAQVRRLVGSIIKAWREQELKVPIGDFAEHYRMSERFVRMIESGRRLPPSILFIGMIMDMDWWSRMKLMTGFIIIDTARKARKTLRAINHRLSSLFSAH